MQLRGRRGGGGCASEWLSCCLGLGVPSCKCQEPPAVPGPGAPGVQAAGKAGGVRWDPFPFLGDRGAGFGRWGPPGWSLPGQVPSVPRGSALPLRLPCRERGRRPAEPSESLVGRVGRAGRLCRGPRSSVGGRAPCSRAPLSERPGGQSIGVCPAAEGEAAAACPAVSKGAAVAGPRPPGAQACVAASAGAGAARPRRGGRGLGPRHVRAGRQVEGGRLGGGRLGPPLRAVAWGGRGGRPAGRWSPRLHTAGDSAPLRQRRPAGGQAGGEVSGGPRSRAGAGAEESRAGAGALPPARPPACPPCLCRKGGLAGPRSSGRRQWQLSPAGGGESPRPLRSAGRLGRKAAASAAGMLRAPSPPLRPAGAKRALPRSRAI